MPLASDTAGSVSRRALWFGLLGGAVAWTLHLIGSWVVAEFGCVMAAQRGAGVTATVVLLVVVSAVTLAGAVAATVVAYRSLRALRDAADDTAPGDADNERFMARAGLVTSGLFAFIVAVESVPILFFLRHC